MIVEVSDQTAPEVERSGTGQSAEAARAASTDGLQALLSPRRSSKPELIEPDLDFIHNLHRVAGDTFMKCMQCGTCTATCSLAPARSPFPRKEVIWALWGMKGRLLRDADIWLCHYCKDCSTRCPRGARPGDVLAAIRQQVVIENATPRFLGRWVNQGRFAPVLLLVPVVLLGAAILVRAPLGRALGFADQTGEPIVFSYSSFLPHWLLNGFFLMLFALVLAASAASITRYWRALRREDRRQGRGEPVKSLSRSVGAALRRILVHRDFASCTTEHSRRRAHLGVFFGFLGLSLVTFWIITHGINPLLNEQFVYPFGFLNPWKILANVGGLALLFGAVLMIRDRVRESLHRGAYTYFHWSLNVLLLAVILTGFAAEAAHYMRFEPHRHVIYGLHLVLVFTLLAYMPYSKLAHIIYRTTALIHAEYVGREPAPYRVTLEARTAGGA
jgi:quinone-modifying oxidoreductase subunit QmoC